MKMKSKSILVISPEQSVWDAIENAVSDTPDVRVDTEASTLSQINGKAVKMASDYDVVLFQTSDDGDADINAIQALAKDRANGTVLVAMADDDISLSQARALNHAGVDEVLPISMIGAEIADQIVKIDRASQAAATNAAPLGKIIAVAQARGGAGSTTVAVNLADQLQGRNKSRVPAKPGKVALVDLDLQFGTVGSFLDMDEQDTLLQLALDGTIPDATFLGQSMTTMHNGLSVLAAPSKFAPLDSLRTDQVAAILDTLRQSHEYVIVDLPRALVGWIEAIIERADELIIVTDISVSSVRHSRRLIDFFTIDNVTLPIQIVVNHEKKPLMQSSLHREAAKALERKLDHWLPHDPNAANAASDKGKPLSSVAPRSPLTKAVARLAKTTKADFQTASSKLNS
ncbi:MAG: AAA family ATPase [Marinosulfonomonas sp.]|nr:AAA family ATPase [Marinosulfonomonas sp.]